MSSLLNVDDALRRILQDMHVLPSEAVGLQHALGRVLASDVRAEINIPPFANSSMDGFAVRAGDVADATRAHAVTLRLVMDIPAGTAPTGSLKTGETARIMTGAPLPPGADAIVPVEATDQQFEAGAAAPLPEVVQIFQSVQSGAHIRWPGEDFELGQTVLQAGSELRPQEIGVLASLGMSEVQVVRRPRVAVVSTGDELVLADEPLTPGKIRDVNSYTLAGLVQTYGGEAVRVPIARDTLEDVRRRFGEALAAQPDMIVSSAGVSVGTFDVVRAVLAELGQVDFWRINLRPGKPLAYGSLNGVPFFGLPGNPVSAMVTFDVFVRPAMLKLMGRPVGWPTVMAMVGEDLTSDGRRSYLRVKLTREDGHLVARSTGTQSSGALMSMVAADGLLIVPEGVREVVSGTMLQVRLLKQIEELR